MLTCYKCGLPLQHNAVTIRRCVIALIGGVYTVHLRGYAVDFDDVDELLDFIGRRAPVCNSPDTSGDVRYIYYCADCSPDLRPYSHRLREMSVGEVMAQYNKAGLKQRGDLRV